MTQGRHTCANQAIASPHAHSHEKHSLPQSTHPAIALKSCSASRIYSAQEFPAQRGPAKLTICCKMQELAIFCRGREDLWAAAQNPAMPSGPAPGMLHVELSQYLLSPVETPPRGAAPMGCPSTPRGEPHLPSRCFHPDYPPSSASSRQGRVDWGMSTASPFFRDQMG